MSNQRDSTLDVLRLLDNLRQLAAKPKTFAGIAFGYNAEEMVMQIEKVRASLPREVKDAASIARATERILESANEEAVVTVDQAKVQADRTIAEAKAEAERIVEQARLAQEQMIADSEILKLAKAQADEVRNSAERESNQMRRGADRYALEVMTQLEATVGKVLAQVERGKTHLSESETALAAQPLREKVKAL
ncbi:MAG: hypothetical protein KF884_10090 [Fimbriimonadaceae bacterium]|nr:hypothetical protein [Fimbriimonadaceae bacterium]QYK57896.1 MAG: hypothetical protein KF884_10090 [Fimbriimonadaceae bacterium]